MKANELRIGNYIHHLGRVMEVKKTYYVSLILDFCEPIPLTEEWLLKFGFEKSSYYYEIKGIAISLGEDGRTILNGCGEVNAKHCVYVHQLQNLYFALTGKELYETNH
jgi:hypothetical protein